jgi:hypothetical protein
VCEPLERWAKLARAEEEERERRVPMRARSPTTSVNEASTASSSDLSSSDATLPRLASSTSTFLASSVRANSSKINKTK